MKIDFENQPETSSRSGAWFARVPAFFIKIALVGCGMAVTISTATAQTDPDTTAQEEIRRSQQRLEQERRRSDEAPDVRLDKETAPAETVEILDETPCFTIHTIRLEGRYLDRFSWLREYLSPYIGRCIGREGINRIIKGLTSRLIERGYVTTRIGIPEQDIAGGVLRLMLIPGVISDIRFDDENIWGTWKTAFPARRGDLLNLRDIEQGLEQMKRVPYQDVDIQIKPGERPGESDLILSVQRQKPWRIALSLDDSGSRATGRLQTAATLSWDNPFGANDLFSFTWSHDAATKNWMRGTAGESLYYSVPFGYWTVSGQGSVYDYHQTVQGAVETLRYSGTSRSAEVVVQRLVWRSRTSKTGIQFRLDKRKSKTYLNDVEIEIQRRDRTDAEIGLSHKRHIGRAVMDVTAGFRKGVHWLNAEPDPADLAPDGPTTRYKMGLLDASLVAPFTLWGVSVQYRARGRAQYTGDRLLVADQFAIGNRYTVRGFDGEYTLLAEKGWYLRNELGIPLFRTEQEVYLGIDYGAVSGPSDEALPGKHLTGSVLGVRGKYKWFSYDAFAGWPIYRPDEFRTDRPALGFYVSVQF